MASKTTEELVPGQLKEVKVTNAKFDYFAYACINEDGEHFSIGFRRLYGDKQIEAKVFRSKVSAIETQTFERYELDFQHPDAKWSKQKQWLFPWAQYFVWRTDSVAETPNHEDEIAKNEAEIDRLQRLNIALKREDKQRYHDVPVPPFAQIESGK